MVRNSDARSSAPLQKPLTKIMPPLVMNYPVMKVDADRTFLIKIIWGECDEECC